MLLDVLHQLPENVDCSPTLPISSVSDSNLVDNLYLFKAVQSFADFLQVKMRRRHPQGLHQHLQLLFRTVPSFGLPQDDLGAENELPGDVVVWFGDLLQLAQQLPAMGGIPLDAASDDFLLQGGDFLFALAEQGKITVIRQSETLQQGVDAVAGGGLPSVSP